MAVTDDEINKAVAVTGRFENAGDPWSGVTGDFDGMGISCGVLQWNIGSAAAPAAGGGQAGGPAPGAHDRRPALAGL
jgi:hypothetical protein